MTTQPLPQTQTDDPFDAADRAVPLPPIEYEDVGQVTTIDPWFCVFERGAPAGKRVYDPARDQPDRRRIAVKIVISPLRPNAQWLIEQEATDADPEFMATKESYEKLHKTLRDLRGAWVRIKRRPMTKYAKKGEDLLPKADWTGQRTAIVFLEIYPDEATARAAAEKLYGSAQRTAGPAHPEVDLPADMRSVGMSGLAPDDAARAFADSALAAFRQAAGGDAAKLAKLINLNPLVARYYTEEGEPIPF